MTTTDPETYPGGGFGIKPPYFLKTNTNKKKGFD